MNKKLAFDNRLCYERTVARQHALHQQKLQSMVPTALSPSKVYLDSNAPTKHPHLGTNAKRKQLDKERQDAISAQNQRLASKMEHILHRQENVRLAAASTYGVAPLRSPRAIAAAAHAHATAVYAVGASSPRTPMPPSANPSALSERSQHLAGGDSGSCCDAMSPPRTPMKTLSPTKKPFARGSPARVHMPGIRLDATQTPLVDCYLSPEVAIGRGTACDKRSLINRGVQKRQQERLAEENRRMKQRVSAQKPSYDTKKWDADWQKSGQKFAHIRQNGTVGYLLPPPKTANASGCGTSHTSSSDGVNASPRALKTQRAIRTSHGLPLIYSRGSHDEHAPADSSTTRRERRDPRGHLSAKPDTTCLGGRQVASQRQSFESESDDGMQVVELAPCVLLEATTRKGIQIYVEELQIELLSAKSASRNGVEVGDRGLAIRGKWMENIEGAHSVSVETLERIAQELDDLEIMIKLETVHRIAHVGNFPRLSELLTEQELEKLLFRLVQRLQIEVCEDRNELLISTRAYRATAERLPSAWQGEELVAAAESESKQRRRPRTCPSMMPSNAIFPGVLEPSCLPEEDNTAPVDHEQHEKTRQQLGSWLNVGATRFGIRHDGALYLVRISFSADACTLMTNALPAAMPVGSDSDYIKREAVLSQLQVEALVRQLETQQLTRDELVKQEIHKLLC